MTGEIVESSQLIQALLEAAKKEDWERVDEKLIPQLGKIDSNVAAKELLGYVSDENPNIRDVVATSFAYLRGLNPEIESRVIEAMFEMAKEDKERYSAGRAAAYLLSLEKRPGLEDRVSRALEEFKGKANSCGWTSDLKEAIPALSDFLS
jgi:HEAT repeat protein